MKTKKIILSKYFVGFPNEDNFKMLEEELQPLKDGEVICEAVYLSVDPYMRCQIHRINEGDIMFGTQVAKIIESKHSDWPIGSYAVTNSGWQTLSVSNGKDLKKLPEMGELPSSLALGIMGMPGMTAFFGMEKLCPHIQSSDIIVVSTAAGAVGHLVGQIAKITKACVIGLTGSNEKVDWLLNDLAFDYAFNYKTTNLDDAIKSVTPNGINYYFDNVGGSVSSIILKHMKQCGSVLICGSISTYCEVKRRKDAADNKVIKSKQLKVTNFSVFSWEKQWDVGFKQMYEWICQGKVKYREHIIEGFANMPQALISIFNGINIGKVIVTA